MFNMLWPINIGRSLVFKVGMPVAEGRNACVQHALALEGPTCEVDSLFWLDDDVVPQPEAILRLYSHYKPIVSGVYFTKDKVFPQPLILPGKAAGTDEFIPDKVYETYGHGMGLVLVKMDIYKRLLEKGLPKDKNNNPEWYRTSLGCINDPLGGNIDAGGTEDTVFLEKIKADLGISTFIDTSKHAFGWHRDRMTGECYPLKQWHECREGKPITWETSQGTFTWDR